MKERFTDLIEKWSAQRYWSNQCADELKNVLQNLDEDDLAEITSRMNQENFENWFDTEMDERLRAT